jgi:hypothetical protein
MSSEIKLIHQDEVGDCRGITVRLANRATTAIQTAVLRGNARCRSCDAKVRAYHELLVMSQYMVATKTMIMNFLCPSCAKPINQVCMEVTRNGETEKAKREHVSPAIGGVEA